MTKVVIQESKKGTEPALVTVSGTAMYASIQKPRKAYDPSNPDLYQLDLVVDKATDELLSGLGINRAKSKGLFKFHAGYEGQPVYTFKRSTVNKDGSPKFPPQVVDSNTNPIPKTTMIGNGSKVNVELYIFTYKMPGKSGTSATINGVQVVDLVEYKKEGSSNGSSKSGFSVVGGGFVASMNQEEKFDRSTDIDDTSNSNLFE